jgi:hypothetical protein
MREDDRAASADDSSGPGLLTTDQIARRLLSGERPPPNAVPLLQETALGSCPADAVCGIERVCR